MSIYNILCGLGDIYPPGTLINTQEFLTAGSATWTKSVGTDYIIIEIIGGGGSGGSSYNGDSQSQGGQGGSYVRYWAGTANLGATEEVFVGAGGVAQKSNGSYGNYGSFSWFGRAIWAAGGYGGRGQFTGINSAPSYSPTVSQPLWVSQASETGAVGGYGIAAGSNATDAGGGGGGSKNNGSGTPNAGGSSSTAGGGGAGTNASYTAGTAGSAPGGGGGAATWTAFSGAGAVGKIIVKSYA
jgi:hypothetical protein